jgi:hypothetical protein
MKTTTLAAVAVVAVLIVGVLSLNYDRTPNPHVEITSFNTTGTSSGSSYGVVHVWFVLNLTNTGTGDVENLTITLAPTPPLKAANSSYTLILHLLTITLLNLRWGNRVY